MDGDHDTASASTPDERALADLRAVKERIGVELEDESIAPYIHARLLAEFRLYVTLINQIAARVGEPSGGYNIVDDLRARRAERLGGAGAPASQ